MVDIDVTIPWGDDQNRAKKFGHPKEDDFVFATPTLNFYFYDGGTRKHWKRLKQSVFDQIWEGAWVLYRYYWSSTDLVTHGGKVYSCISNHTSSSDTEPGVGDDWADRWGLVWDVASSPLGLWLNYQGYSVNDIVFSYEGGIKKYFVCMKTYTASVSQMYPGSIYDYIPIKELETDETDLGSLEYESQQTMYVSQQKHSYEFRSNDFLVPDSVWEDEYVNSIDEYKWERQPIQIVEDEDDGDRYDIGSAYYNLRVEAKRGGSASLDISKDLKDDGEDKGNAKIYDGTEDTSSFRYKWRTNSSGAYGLAVSEIGSESRGHYYKLDAEATTYSSCDDWIRPQGIFFAGFDTSDTTNFKVTTSPDYDDDAVSGFFVQAIGGGQIDVEIYLMPRRWAYYFRTSSYSNTYYVDLFDIRVWHTQAHCQVFYSTDRAEALSGSIPPCSDEMFQAGTICQCYDSQTPYHCIDEFYRGEPSPPDGYWYVWCDEWYHECCDSNWHDYNPPATYSACGNFNRTVRGPYSLPVNYITDPCPEDPDPPPDFWTEWHLKVQKIDFKHYICFYWNRPPVGYVLNKCESENSYYDVTLTGCKSGTKTAKAYYCRKEDEQETDETAAGGDSDDILCGMSSMDASTGEVYKGDLDDIQGGGEVVYGVSAQISVPWYGRVFEEPDPDRDSHIPLSNMIQRSDLFETYGEQYDEVNYLEDKWAGGVGISPHKAGTLEAIVKVGRRVYYVWRKQDETFTLLTKTEGDDAGFTGLFLGFEHALDYLSAYGWMFTDQMYSFDDNRKLTRYMVTPSLDYDPSDCDGDYNGCFVSGNMQINLTRGVGSQSLDPPIYVMARLGLGDSP